MSTEMTGATNGPQREKYWEELDADGKIERCRKVIKEQQKIIQRMAGYLDKLVTHQHMDGKMVQPISHPNAESYGGFHHRKRPDEWF